MHQTLLSTLATNAALLETTERRLNTESLGSVDIHHPSFQLPSNAQCTASIVRENTRRQAIASIVSHLDRLLLSLEGPDRDDRTKDLFTVNTRIVLGVQEDRGLDVESRCAVTLAASNEFGLAFADFEEIHHTLELLAVDDRP